MYLSRICFSLWDTGCTREWRYFMAECAPRFLIACPEATVNGKNFLYWRELNQNYFREQNSWNTQKVPEKATNNLQHPQVLGPDRNFVAMIKDTRWRTRVFFWNGFRNLFSGTSGEISREYDDETKASLIAIVWLNNSNHAQNLAKYSKVTERHARYICRY